MYWGLVSFLIDILLLQIVRLFKKKYIFSFLNDVWLFVIFLLILDLYELYFFYRIKIIMYIKFEIKY